MPASEEDRRAAEMRAQGRTWHEIAAELGTPNDGPTDAERRDAEAARNFGSGGTPPGREPTPEPHADMLHAYNEARDQGQPREKAQNAGFAKLFAAAAAGDERVVSSSSAEARGKWARRHGFDVPEWSPFGR